MYTLIAALLSLSSAFAETRALDTDVSDNVWVALDAADPDGAWTLLPAVTDPGTAAARAKADIIIEVTDGAGVAVILDLTVLRQQPWTLLASTGQALVSIDPDEIDFDGALESIDPDEIDFDGALESIDPDEIDVAAMLKSGDDWLVVNADGTPAGLLISLAE